MCRVSALLLGLAAMGVAAGQTPLLQVRLLTPLTSYDSAKDAEIRSVVIAPLTLDGRVLMPQGTIVSGVVRRRRRVGLGLVRERASIDLDFREYELPDGRRFPLGSQLRGIENARETVTRDGRINGILAANNPQSLLHGIWRRPRLDLFPKSFIGLTGAGGRIFSAYSMGPIGGAVLFAGRLAMFRLPEPEIQLRAGTEMFLRVTRIADDAPSFPIEPSEPVPSALADWLASLPAQILKPGGYAASDIINVAFEGSREQLSEAFRAAGWFEAEALTARTFSRTYNSYTRQTGYPTAPVSKLLYEGAEPDAVFQKSLNTISKRHHVRVWRVEKDRREFWLGAATHDIGVEFNRSAMNFTHKIEWRIDHERSKVVNDLIFAGCIANPGYVDRPGLERAPGNAKAIVTDGRLALLSLQACEISAGSGPADEPRPVLSKVGRIARRMMLEGRQYVLRGNPYYWAYRALSFKRHARAAAEAADD